ncbi:MAG: hypothetical protein GXP47_03445 [Acidobacteria bacterium]|nr:hypothetical protein [Acidobacteriota bacterium]
MSGRGRTAASLVLVCMVAVAGLLLTGCENTTPTPEERQEITKTVLQYLHQLSDAYTNMDARRLKGVASTGEMAAVAKVLHKLAMSGDRLETTLLRADVEDVQVFRVVNATVKLLEVWDVRRLDAYNGKEKGHNPNTIQHSVIQLRKIDGKWLVTFRRVLETEGGSRWKMPTPVGSSPKGADTAAGAGKAGSGDPGTPGRQE